MEQPNIDVGLLTDAEIRFDLIGDFKTNNSKELFSGGYSAVVEGSKIVVEDDKERYEFSSGVEFIPDNFNIEMFQLYGVKIGIDFHWEQRKDFRFQGSLKLIIEEDKITAINIIPLETYLISVIAAEMSRRSHFELLKAQAIVSRTWLLFQVEKRKKGIVKKKADFSITDEETIKWYDRNDHVNYDVCGDDHCQRYYGIVKPVSEKINKAVEETAGFILRYQGKICDARYSKCCGGITELFENVWEPVPIPYIKSIVDYKFEPDDFDIDLTVEKNAEKWMSKKPKVFCNTGDAEVIQQILVDYDQITSNFFRWQLEYSQEEIQSIIELKSGLNFGKILDLIPLERGKSGRIIKLEIIGEKSTRIIGKELEIRKVLSKSHLYSSAFIIKKFNIIDNIPSKFVISGAGWGHGVGLCQIGAALMSNTGYKFDEILLHYFPGVNIRKGY